MIRWAIKHTLSGFYLPEPEGRDGRGGSHVEVNPDDNKARLFKTQRSAKIYLNAWLKGKFVADRGMSQGDPGNDWEVDYYENIRIIPQDHRQEDQMEIVKVEIKLP